MNRPKHNRWLLTLFLVCAIILSLPLPKANAQNFVNNRFNVVVALDASGSMKNTDPNGLRYEAISQFSVCLLRKVMLLAVWCSIQNWQRKKL